MTLSKKKKKGLKDFDILLPKKHINLEKAIKTK